MKKEGRRFNEYDIKSYKLGLVIDLIKAFSRYIKKTDEVSVESFGVGRSGSMIADLNVIREGKLHGMSTEVIVAGGYNIQVAHYRYITHTDLPASENKDSFEKLQERRNKLTKAKKINEDIEYYKNVYKRELDRFNTLKSKTYDQVMNENEYTKINFEDLSEAGKKNFNNNPKEFNAYIKQNRDDAWRKHLNKITDSILNGINREYTAKLKKLEEKLNSL